MRGHLDMLILQVFNSTFITKSVLLLSLPFSLGHKLVLLGDEAIVLKVELEVIFLHFFFLSL